MDDEGQEKAIESLRDWSKSLMTLQLAAVAGCVAVLQIGVAGLPRLFLVLAIAAFALSLLTASVILGMTPTVLQRLPLRDESGRLASVYDCDVWHGVRLRTIVQLQYLFFIAAGAFFVLWVIFKPPPGG
jgi:hypothetical protein